ncbi:Mth938-like domain-containing protein [Fodinibius halophilus]|uniref:Mth938-like domain-containing protein n=1 Tax=Fodinibius halophilus TaxID=1736908 RepID=A0A6M1TE45_9BACT|nr:Mth938-like domain-containing protein [Fodinibius halophilus]NGP86950.1 hypothetical protein [Fodinibius halophilus]
MAPKKKSPKIHSIEWGKVTLSNRRTHKDAKLFPSGSREWDWNETGTHHVPGIQPADVEELLERGSEIVILSQGFHERLQVCQETKKYLNERNIDFHILETEQAKQKYNDLRTNLPVGALIHSTC